MKWVTRAQVKVDRVACPWLIKKFIDPDAEFVFVPRDTDPATITEGTPFDMKGVELGHHGSRCSFDAIIEKFGLAEPALLLMADIVRAADVASQRCTRLEGAGLEAIAKGFAVLFDDDDEILTREFLVYDALYEYCKSVVAPPSAG
jgi:hypothetical protein